LLIILTLATCGTATSGQDVASPGPDAASNSSTGGGSTASPAQEHFRQGNEFSQAGESEKAVDQYLMVLETEPQNVDAMTNLGVAYYSLGKLDEAVEQYRKALAIAPNDADIHSNLAAAYVQKYQQSGAQEQLDTALAEYQKAVELAPGLSEAHFGLGVVYLLLGRNDDALQALEKFLDLDTGKDPLATANAKEYIKQLRGQ
jgi:Flp pilus assembly protein TadD